MATSSSLLLLRMRSRAIGVAAAVRALSVPPVRADVVLSETLAMKVAHSAVLALARFVSVEGTGPFTNARPPAATLRVSRAIRGCQVGALLRVADWGRSRPPEPRGGPHQTSPDAAHAADDAWAATVIEPDGPEARRRIQSLIDGDSPDQWPRDEERDLRFAPSADTPAVEQRRIGIEKRLAVP